MSGVLVSKKNYLNDIFKLQSLYLQLRKGNYGISNGTFLEGKLLKVDDMVRPYGV